jgi:diaminopimelate decarboxylase
MSSNSVMDQVWPQSARWADGELRLGGIGVAELARAIGTPVYVLDEDDFRARCAAWTAAFPGGDIRYGGKAFLAPAVVGWLRELGISLDVCSGGELAIAQRGGMPPGRVVFHGNNKSVAEIRRAVEWGVGCIVLDSLQELERVAGAARGLGLRQAVMIRVKPGVEADTHAAWATGGERTKFGLSAASGEAAEGVRRVLSEPALDLVGLHSHIGSQIFDLNSFGTAAERMMDFLRAMERTHGVRIGKLDLGGGLGVPYLPSEKNAPTPAELAAVLRSVVPADIHIALEPGRSIWADSDLTNRGSTTYDSSPSGSSGAADRRQGRPAPPRPRPARASTAPASSTRGGRSRASGPRPRPALPAAAGRRRDGRTGDSRRQSHPRTAARSRSRPTPCDRADPPTFGAIARHARPDPMECP